MTDLNKMAWNGHTDWRMPTIRALESLVSLNTHSPALPTGHPFTRVRDAYWSSTTSVLEVLNDFLDNAGSQIEGLRKTIAEGDAETVTRQAHAIKGGFPS